MTPKEILEDDRVLFAFHKVETKNRRAIASRFVTRLGVRPTCMFEGCNVSVFDLKEVQNVDGRERFATGSDRWRFFI
jgi:hypothetical protein